MSVRDDLIRDEGWVPHAYQDHLGFWTIGYGFLIDKRRGGGIPKPVAEHWLDYEIQQREQALSRNLTWFDSAPDDIKRALINMAFQLGIGRLMGFRRTLAHLQAGRYAEAADEALNSRWAQQTPNRAQRIAELIRNA